MNNGVYMKKERVPTSIKKEIHQRIKLLMTTQPELEYKTISNFMNKTLEEKLNELENLRLFEQIKREGINEIFDLAHRTHDDIAKVLAHQEKERTDREEFMSHVAEEKRTLIGLKKEIDKRFPKKTHTHSVYTSKKK